MKELVWFIIGFVSAIAWDKYKEWRKFKIYIELMYEELAAIENSLEDKLNELPDGIKEKIKIAQEENVVTLSDTELMKLDSFEFTMPYSTSAWQIFKTSGEAKMLDKNQLSIIKDTYNTIEGTNFVRQLSATMLSATSSPYMEEETKRALYKGVKTNHLLPVMSALPKVRRAKEELRKILNIHVGRMIWKLIKNT